jgi:hypothetical protein
VVAIYARGKRLSSFFSRVASVAKGASLPGRI